MKTNGLTVVLFLAALGLGGWATWEHRQRTGLEEKLALLSAEREVLRGSAAAAQAAKAKTAVKAEGPEGLGEAHSEALAAEAGGEGETAPAKNPMAGMAEMMKDPAMREAMKAQMGPQLDMMYRDFYDLLGLDPAQEQALGKILMERQSAGMELGLAMMSGKKLSPEETAKNAEIMKEAREKTNQSIKELLGEESFSQFERYEKSQPERQQIKSLVSQLTEKGIPLSEEAEGRLMDAMYQERTNFKYDNDLSDETNSDPSRFTEANRIRFMEQQQQMRAQTLSRVEGILSADQLEVFQKAQEQQTKLEEMGMKMATQMMGGGE